MPACFCGCGTKVRYEYARGHRPRFCEECGSPFETKSHHRKLCNNCRLPLCACGCGERVQYPQFKYLVGHHLRGKRKSKTLEKECLDCGDMFWTSNGTRPADRCNDCRKPRECLCGCGRMTKTPGAYFVRGHSNKGRTYSDERCAAIRAAVNRPEHIKKLSHSHRNQSIKQTLPEKLLHTALDKRRCKFVGSGRLHDGSPNPSGLGRDLPISADIVCRSKKIMIMVDGCYWHECPKHGQGKFPDKPKRDAKQTRYAKAAGWNVLRFWEHEIKENQGRIAGLIEAA